MLLLQEKCLALSRVLERTQHYGHTEIRIKGTKKAYETV